MRDYPEKILSISFNSAFVAAKDTMGLVIWPVKCIDASTLILKKYQKAAKVHCKSHLLNLCVPPACTILEPSSGCKRIFQCSPDKIFDFTADNQKSSAICETQSFD